MVVGSSVVVVRFSVTVVGSSVVVGFSVVVVGSSVVSLGSSLEQEYGRNVFKTERSVAFSFVHGLRQWVTRNWPFRQKRERPPEAALKTTSNAPNFSEPATFCEVYFREMLVQSLRDPRTKSGEIRELLAVPSKGNTLKPGSFDTVFHADSGGLFGISRN